MSQQIKIEVMEGILDRNDAIAAGINKELSRAGIFTVNVMGAPGIGKTSVIKNIIKSIDCFESLKSVKPYVVEADIESDLDTKALLELGIETIQINTHGACHLDAPALMNALPKFEVQDNAKGIMFIENIGNLVCPAEFMIGEHAKMLIVSMTDGSDKPYKYPLAFEKADIIIVNKADLEPYIDFDKEYFLKGVRALNKTAPVILASAKTGAGFEEVGVWIEEKMKTL